MGKRLGFTLIELILVMAVIALLAVAVFLAIRPQKRIGDAMDDVRVTDAKVIEDAIQYATADGLSLSSLDNIVVDTPYMLVKEGESTSGKTTCNILGGDIDKISIISDIKNELSKVPTDPSLDPSSVNTGYFIYKHNNVYHVESCDSYDKIDNFSCGDTIRDVELHEYNTLLIGSQCWLAQSLNIGSMLAGPTNNPSDNGVVEKWCYSSDSSICTTDGGLYLWDEAMKYSTTNGAQGICPNGWHIPTDEEIKTLEMSLGMSQVQADLDASWRGTNEGTKIKIGGSSGFNLVLSGARDINATFAGRNTFGYMWSSTESSSNARRRVVNSGATIYRDAGSKNRGQPVRCLRN